MATETRNTGASTICAPTSSLKIKVYQRDEQFIAEIEGGWWVAHRFMAWQRDRVWLDDMRKDEQDGRPAGSGCIVRI
jgi:hypothetical protein